jgi:hypothetical protein
VTAENVKEEITERIEYVVEEMSMSEECIVRQGRSYN